MLNARILRLPSPVVNDYACPFGALGSPAGLGVLNARILRLPRPVVNDYACPFGPYACPFGLYLAFENRTGKHSSKSFYSRLFEQLLARFQSITVKALL